MEINPIKTDEDNAAALKEIEALWNAAPGTPEGDRLDILVTLVHAYEEKRYPMEPPDAVEMLEFMMEQQNKTANDLALIVGGPDQRGRGARSQALPHASRNLATRKRVARFGGMLRQTLRTRGVIYKTERSLQETVPRSLFAEKVRHEHSFKVD